MNLLTVGNPKVLKGMEQGYMTYINDVSTLAIPIAHPVMSNNTDKELVLKPWF